MVSLLLYVVLLKVVVGMFIVFVIEISMLLLCMLVSVRFCLVEK